MTRARRPRWLGASGASLLAMIYPSSVNGTTHEFVASDTQKGGRWDLSLALLSPDLPRPRLQGLTAKGAVTRGGATIGAPNKRVNPGAATAIHVPAPAPATPQPQSIPLTIVH